MKVVVALLFVALVYVNAEVTPEQIDKLKNFIKECKAKIEVTDEDVGLLMQHKVPETETGKCFAACIQKGLGVLDDDNKMDLKRVAELMEHVKDKVGDKYEAMMKIFETCAAEVPGGSDECEVSAKLMECKNREFEAADIKISFINIFSHDEN